MDKKVFDYPNGQTYPDIISICKNFVEEINYEPAHRWKEAGGKILGHFQVYFPEEIAHAAGMLPFKIRGAPLDGKNADSHFGSYLCSILKTSLELGLADHLNLDMFVSHPICDAARNLAAIWGRNFDYPSQILYLPQNANSSHSAAYLRDEYARLLEEVVRISGKQVSEQDLRESIGVFNKNRALIRELYQIKRETPWLLPIEEAYALVSIGGMIPREEHNQLLELVLPQIKAQETKKRDKIRVVFEGGFCEQPPLELLQTISRYCYVVDDDLLIGLRWITQDVPAEGDPLLNLAEAYLNCSSYSPVQHDARKPKEKMLLERIKNAGADAAIVTAAKMCEPGLEEQVTYALTLNERDIPYFISEFEENMTSFDHLEIQLETFAENILFS